MLCEIPDIGFGCLNWVSKSGVFGGGGWVVRRGGRKGGKKGREGKGREGKIREGKGLREKVKRKYEESKCDRMRK